MGIESGEGLSGRHCLEVLEVLERIAKSKEGKEGKEGKEMACEAQVPTTVTRNPFNFFRPRRNPRVPL